MQNLTTVSEILDTNEYALRCLKTGKGVEIGDYEISFERESFIKFGVRPMDSQFTCKVTTDQIMDALMSLGHIVDSDGDMVEVETMDIEPTKMVDGEDFLDSGVIHKPEVALEILSEMAAKALNNMKDNIASYFDLSSRIGILERLKLAA